MKPNSVLATILNMGKVVHNCELNHLMSRCVRAPLVAQTVKHLPAIQETQVRSLGQEDPLDKGMATHSRILAWRIPGTKEPGGL